MNKTWWRESRAEGEPCGPHGREPNNWEAAFSGQPDLNWENPKVRARMAL